MKRLLPLIAFILVWSSNAFAAITVVQTRTTTWDNVTGAQNFTDFASQPTVGNCIIATVAAGNFSGSLTMTISDNQSNSYTTTQANDTDVSFAGIGVAKVTTSSGAFHVTVTFPGSTSAGNGSASEVSGLDSNCTIDKTGTNTSGFLSTSNVVAASGANTSSNELSVSVLSLSASSAQTITNSYSNNLWKQNDPNAHWAGSGDYKVEVSTVTSSNTYSFTSADGGHGGTVGVIITIAGSGGGGGAAVSHGLLSGVN
jgi:hypothetical protein